MSAAPPGLSWLATAFFAPVPQGIRLRALIRLAILLPSGLPTLRIPPPQADGFTLAVRPDFSSSRVAADVSAATCLSFPSLVISNSNIKYKSKKHLYMGQNRVELLTPALSERCSNQLSYHPARHHAAGKKDILHHAPLAHEPLCSTLCLFFLFPEKEVIQPHLPVRLPCYDFTPLTGHTLGSGPLAVSLPTSGIPGSDGVTGGVYKARERIHRAVLMRDY